MGWFRKSFPGTNIWDSTNIRSLQVLRPFPEMEMMRMTNLRHFWSDYPNLNPDMFLNLTNLETLETSRTAIPNTVITCLPHLTKLVHLQLPPAPNYFTGFDLLEKQIDRF